MITAPSTTSRASEQQGYSDESVCAETDGRGDMPMGGLAAKVEIVLARRSLRPGEGEGRQGRQEGFREGRKASGNLISPLTTDN